MVVNATGRLISQEIHYLPLSYYYFNLDMLKYKEIFWGGKNSAGPSPLAPGLTVEKSV